MPELPEVETVKRVVEPQIKGKKITKINITNEQVINYPSCDEFISVAENSIITGMFRRGKFLGINLNNGTHILLHFRMTGGLLVTPSSYPVQKHTHLTMILEDGNEIRYIDPRRFGRFWLIDKEVDDISGINKLGLEPFDEKMTKDYLISKIGTRNKTIKECLLDQSIVTGIGNIYGDEILFIAGINPTKKASKLSATEWQKLSETIPKALSFFIDKNTISAEDYLIGKGKDYRSAPFLKVYGHGGEPCINCGDTLCKIIISGRSSVYCPSCQK